ncbi:probable carboxylesterase 18 [Ziziphus jujuba]|uniref:Probable carboxylesterase 18 n=1 Tax=Ziziphus jujuba TaxID=326968 RepID=A0ABM4AD72_ZIZJJ|nr:probable carboxylesterase 18 [Ziziphus jujuba]
MLRTLPDLPWTVRLFNAAFGFLMKVCCRSDGTLNRTVVNLADLKASPLNKPVKGLQSSDIIVDHTRNLWFRLHTPTQLPSTVSLPVIVYFHGGGFILMSADSKYYDAFCQRLARELPAVVISVNYRLAPEHRYPSQYDDGFDVLKFIDGDDGFKDRFPANADLRRCFVGGDSAGGNLAHHVAVMAAKHDFKKLDVVGILGIQPFFGGEERSESENRFAATSLLPVDRTDWMWKAFLPEGSNRNHPVVNVFGPDSADISGLKRFPTTMVIVGGFDPLQDWQKRYCEWLKKQGKEVHMVEYPNAVHAFYIFPELKESSLMIKEIRDFVESN